MKRVVPTLLFTIAMLFGKAQTTSLWFNELVPDPGQQEDEYIEFYNTSTSDIPLDCYVLVSYFKSTQGNNTQEGFYVYNFPTNATIKALSNYLISSDNPVSFKSNNNLPYTPTDLTSFNNWNDIGAGGYIYKYTYNTNGTLNSVQSVGNNFNDFMDVRNGFDATLFLFKINDDGTTSYINGFIANPQASDVSALITRIRSLNSLPILPGSTCASNAPSVNLSLSEISTGNTDIISLQQATGSGQGYAKDGDGYCGSWEKIQQGEFSPGTKNTFGTATSEITTEEYYFCGNTVTFSIQSGTSGYFPIEVKLYYDKGTIGEFDVADEFKSSILVQSPDPGVQTFSIADNNQQVLLVYQSLTGCFGKIGAPSTTATVDLTGSISCTLTNNKRTVTYSIASVSTSAVLPLNLQCIDDNGTPDNTSDDVIIGTQTINSTSFIDYTAEMVNINSNITLSVQSSTHLCVTNSELVVNNCTILPVRFRSFIAVRNKQNKELVLLNWETASELNNRGFYIQCKTSGEWKNIAFVASQTDDGNSNSVLTYEYKDINASNSVTQYRIQQVDIDEKTSFSDVRTVMSADQEGGVLIYPNPGINGKVNVLFREQNAVKLVIVSDLNGRLIKQFPQVKDIKLTIEGLQSGFYTIKIIDRSTLVTSVEKVIIN